MGEVRNYLFNVQKDKDEIYMNIPAKDAGEGVKEIVPDILPGQVQHHLIPSHLSRSPWYVKVPVTMLAKKILHPHIHMIFKEV